MVDLTTTTHVAQADPVTNAAEILEFQQLVRMVPIGESVARYAVDMVRATRAATRSAPDFVKKYVNYGASVRAAQFLVLAAKARALMQRPLPRDLRRHPRAVHPGAAAPHPAELPRRIGPPEAGRHPEAPAGVEAGAEGRSDSALKARRRSMRTQRRRDAER